MPRFRDGAAVMPGFVHWPGPLGFVFVVVIILVLVAVVPLTIALTARQVPGKPRMAPGAEEELRVRFAKGEIDATELNERLAALRATERVS